MKNETDLSIPVVVELNQTVSELIIAAGDNVLRQEITNGLLELINLLGLPGTPVVTIRAGHSSRVISVRVHQRLSFPSRELMQRLWLAGTPPLLHEWIDDSQDAGLDEWLIHYISSLKESLEDSAWGLMLKFLARLVLEVIKQHSSYLLSRAQAAEYLHIGKEQVSEMQWTLPETDETIADLKIYLESLLALGVSLANREMVLVVFIGGRQLGRSIEDSVESAFLRLRTNRIDIQVNPHSLSDLVGERPGSELIPVTDPQVNLDLQEMFRNLQVEMFDELGLRLPDLALTLLPEQELGTVVIVINGLRGAPIPMLSQGEVLINGKLSSLSQFGVVGRPARMPVVGTMAAIISQEDYKMFEQAGYLTWDVPSYLVLSLANEVRQMADRLLSLEDIEYQMAQLEQSFPELVHTVMSCYSLEDITRVLRGLLYENVPIRDLRAVFEQLLQFDTIPVNSNAYIVLDRRLAVPETSSPQSEGRWLNYLEFVRMGLGEVIGDRISLGRDSIEVLLLSKDVVKHMQDLIERSQYLGGTPVLDEVEETPILEMIRKKVAALADTGNWPAILTISEIRPFLSSLLRAEFPRLEVISFQELWAQTNIEIIDTLELNV